MTFEIVTNVTFTPTLKDADFVRINSQADDDFIRFFCAGKEILGVVTYCIRNTIEYFGLWETLHNANFNPLEFDGFRKEAGLNAFTLSPTRWIEATNAIGLVSKSGRYGGTYAISDIAFKFANWVSVEFELYLVMEFQRLKAKEQELIGWTAKRELSKINYRWHSTREHHSRLQIPSSRRKKSLCRRNGRSTRIWLDLIFKARLRLCVDWSMIDKKAYLAAMKQSTTNARTIKSLLQGAMTDRIDDREIFMKGIDYSYYYEQEADA